MRTILLTIALAACSSQALAQDDPTDVEVFRKRVSRLAPLPGQTVRGLCVCQDGSGNHGRAGEFRQEPGISQVRVTCAVPGFTGPGSFISYSTCGTFVPLAR